MVSFLVRATVKCVVLAVFLYSVFFVKVGRFTPYEHGVRIAGTQEAQELKTGVADAAAQAKSAALQRMGNPGVPGGAPGASGRP